MAKSRIAAYLRVGSLVQLAFMLVVGLILYDALTQHWDTLRRVSLFLKNGFFGTPEPLHFRPRHQPRSDNYAGVHPRRLEPVVRAEAA